ncbi:MAG: lysophospholipid acyltransferase family protein [Chloroflexi bacterium]|nr:lysophospholipid acyltransferase family protein [Chloroflexota bacterium]
MALYLIIQIGALLSRYIPRSWRYLIGTAIGDAVFYSWPSKRRILLDNMATVLGRSPQDPHVRRLALKSMRNYCKYLIEFLELPTAGAADDMAALVVRRDGIEHYYRAVEAGKGVIVASGHFGTIEVGAAILNDRAKFHAVSDTFRPPALDRLIKDRRRKLGIHPIPVSSVRQMLRALRQGDALAMLFDRPMDLEKGVRVRFFGRETALPAGPAVLALKTGAALLPMYQFRLPDRSFGGVCFPPVSWVPTGDRERDVQAITQKLADSLQTMVRQRPDQWYMFRPMWPNQSDEERAPARTADSAARP